MIVAILRSQGLDAHMTQGISAIHFLRDAVQYYKDEYKRIFKEYLSNGYFPFCMESAYLEKLNAVIEQTIENDIPQADLQDI